MPKLQRVAALAAPQLAKRTSELARALGDREHTLVAATASASGVRGAPGSHVVERPVLHHQDDNVLNLRHANLPVPNSFYPDIGLAHKAKMPTTDSLCVMGSGTKLRTVYERTVSECETASVQNS